MAEETSSYDWLRVVDYGQAEDEVKLSGSKRYNATKRNINLICKNLTLETKIYKPKKSVESIEAYIKAKDKMSRILYSEISSYLFNLSEELRAVFLTNVEKLMIYALDEDTIISDDAAKIVVKIYDHTQLVNYQIESMNNVFQHRIVDAKIDLQKEIKGVEKEYITILGIFASIILAFVGTFTFSTSVLNNVSDTNALKLVAIALVIGLVFFNIINVLIQFLREINDKVERNKKGNQKKSKYFWPVNIILCVLIIITVLILGDFQWLRWLQWLLLHIMEIFKSPS